VIGYDFDKDPVIDPPPPTETFDENPVWDAPRTEKAVKDDPIRDPAPVFDEDDTVIGYDFGDDISLDKSDMIICELPFPTEMFNKVAVFIGSTPTNEKEFDSFNTLLPEEDLDLDNLLEGEENDSFDTLLNAVSESQVSIDKAQGVNGISFNDVMDGLDIATIQSDVI